MEYLNVSGDRVVHSKQSGFVLRSRLESTLQRGRPLTPQLSTGAGLWCEIAPASPTTAATQTDEQTESCLFLHLEKSLGWRVGGRQNKKTEEGKKESPGHSVSGGWRVFG